MWLTIARQRRGQRLDLSVQGIEFSQRHARAFGRGLIRAVAVDGQLAAGGGEVDLDLSLVGLASENGDTP